MNDTGVSVIICTYERPTALRSCIDSLLKQTRLPLELIVVDNSKTANTESLVSELSETLAARGIKLTYVKNQFENSLTYARNLGMQQAKGEFILYLDDDVVLEEGYIEGIRNVFLTYPHAVGAQGFIKRAPYSFCQTLLRKLFFEFHVTGSHCLVFPSVSATYPNKLTEPANCQCLSGANHAVRRSVFERVTYDERLKKYSDGEDLDFSFRLWKEWPQGLYITPEARLTHMSSPEGRALGRELIFMQEIYGVYLLRKLFDPTLRNVSIYVWNRIGRLIASLLRAVKRPRTHMAELRYRMQAYLSCLSHLSQICNGDLEFFNRTLKR